MMTIISNEISAAGAKLEVLRPAASSPSTAVRSTAVESTAVESTAVESTAVSTKHSAEDIRRLALDAGADDAAVIAIDHPALVEDRPYIEAALPGAKTVIALVLRMHPDNVRSPARSVANLEFHQAGQTVDEVARGIVRRMAEHGHRTINPAMAFPMEMQAFPGRTWVVSHKRVAEGAGLGKMGLHRNLIHPKFGSFVLLGSVLTRAEVSEPPTALEFNPCFDCKLCVAACPVGAIEPDGTFRFSACYDHNYREFMSGFGDVLEEVAESRGRQDLRTRLRQPEIASTWQSLAYKPNYKAAFCVAVCPAGDEVIAPFLEDRAEYLRDVMKPLTEATETVFVVEGSDAEAHVRRRFPHKPVRQVRSSLRPAGPRSFFRSLPLTFQRGPARGWSATFHFTLADADGDIEATVRIDDGELDVDEGHVGPPDLSVVAKGADWIELVTGKRHPLLLLLTRRLRVRGDPRLLKKFAACFPR